MAHTNAWSEGVPTGSESASTADDYLRQWRVDLGDRLENMFYGFNAASNASPENNYGIKSLKFYQQTSDPSSDTDYAHVYVKLVDGVPELHWQDDANSAIQLTSGGKLFGTSLKDDSVDSQHYIAASIDNEHLADGAVDTEELAADAVDGTRIADDAVDSEHLAAGGIDAEHIGGIFGASTNTDSDTNTFVVAHAYSAPTDGIVTAWITGNGSSPFTLKGYVGDTDDPAGAGTQEAGVAGYVQEDYSCITFAVPKGKYWEVTRGGNRNYTIRWRAIGTLSAPVDQD